MERINVIESYDLKFCCVCVSNSAIDSFLNVFENVISYQNVYISLAQIILETLGLNVRWQKTLEFTSHNIFHFQVHRNTTQPQEICGNCKTQLVDFFIFKRRNEETRRIYEKSTSQKNILLQVVEHLENMSQEQENNVKEETFEEEFFETHEEMAIDEDLVQEDVYEEPEEVMNVCHEEHLSVSTEVSPEKPAARTKTKVVRRSNPESWKRNTRKLAKNTGQSYVASNGKFVEAKRVKDNCGASCRMQCVKKITEEDRHENFKAFYSLADIAKQRKFLYDHMMSLEPRRLKNLSSPKKCRNVQRHYFLDVTHPNGAAEMVQVCKLMFLNTFCISSQMIDTLHRKALTEGKFNDIRGKFERRSTKMRTEEADCTQPEEPS